MVPTRGLNRLVVADADPPKIRAFGPGQNGCLARGPRQEPNRHRVCRGIPQVDACGVRSYGGPALQYGIMEKETWLKNPTLTRQGDTQELYTGTRGGGCKLGRGLNRPT